jgi:cytochrome b pre-mRNA-processing protein 3
MFGWLSSKRIAKSSAQTLYGEIVSAARNPIFYRDLGVPDTVEGRFELIAAHLSLVLHRLGQAGAPGATIARALNESCITDLDDNMREIGISDLSVPRKIKKAAAALYDRHRDILAALSDPNNSALEAVLVRNIGQLPGATNFKADAIARHLRSCQTALAATPSERVLEGTVSLLPPNAHP